MQAVTDAVLRLKITSRQMDVLRAVWPQLRGERRWNCGQLHTLTKTSMPLRTWLGFMDRLAAKGILSSYHKGNARIWRPGPVSDLLVEEGVLT